MARAAVYRLEKEQRHDKEVAAVNMRPATEAACRVKPTLCS
jgi:hypothetical protein